MMKTKTSINRSQSATLFERAQRVLVGGVNSPVRAYRSVGGDPIFVDKAQGAYIYDVDENCYVDLVGTWGPAIVGHAHPVVVEAVQRAAANGLSFGACCKAEADLAEIIVDALPPAEMVRLVNSGTEACMSAVRLARAATGKSKIIKFIGCYHGHADGFLVAAGSGAATLGVPDSAGVPNEYASLTLLAPYNNLEAVEKLLQEHGKDVAAIIVEPVAGNMGMVEPENGFLAGLRSLCDQHQSLLIFDEVMTGFRVAWGGFQNVCNVTPDLTCLGKVIGGGMPVAAYAGPRSLMEKVAPLGSVYQAGTLSGNPLGMVAGVETLRLCKTAGFYESLHEKVVRITHGWQEAAKAAGIHVQTTSMGGMMGMFFSDSLVHNFDEAKACDHALFARFFQAMLNNGIWLPPSGYEALFLSAAHDDEAIQRIIDAAKEAFRSIVS